MSIYAFRQNNSGGSFFGPALTVYVHANNAVHANSVALANGLYFDGCDDGLDCDCCGDRWYRVSEYDLVTDLNADMESRLEWDTMWAKADNVDLFVIYGNETLEIEA